MTLLRRPAAIVRWQASRRRMQGSRDATLRKSQSARVMSPAAIQLRSRLAACMGAPPPRARTLGRGTQCSQSECSTTGADQAWSRMPRTFVHRTVDREGKILAHTSIHAGGPEFRRPCRRRSRADEGKPPQPGANGSCFCTRTVSWIRTGKPRFVPLSARHKPTAAAAISTSRSMTQHPPQGGWSSSSRGAATFWHCPTGIKGC